jgi:hypothetical protein
MADVGAFPLTGVDGLPNVTVAFPGEHWSDGKAAEAITPGSLVVPINSGGKKFWEVAASGTVDPRAAIALNCVMVPDRSVGGEYSQPLGPNELVNREIAVGAYVHAYHSGAFHLTLIEPDDSYVPSDLIGWDPAAARPTGKDGTGAWVKVSDPAHALFVVDAPFRPYNADGDEGVLTVRSLRGQF